MPAGPVPPADPIIEAEPAGRRSTQQFALVRTSLKGITVIDSGYDVADDRRTDDGASDTGERARALWLAVAGGLAVLVIAAAFFLFAGKTQSHAAPSASESEKAMIDVPTMVVSLRASDGRAHLLKMHVILLATSADKVPAVRTRLPLYVDALQPFLHELRPDDLNGSSAVFRVKEEMLSRAADAFGDGAVRDVLIQDLIQQ
ncbi:flagellar basal body-associated FliL family protein [Sphingomonas sp. RIT328]|uniref:flagellar basal body-associated FliL family protein n=1 Tax=Sphingomonas sp. RIT328 TaxID=1470591 RepID=UPI001F2F7A34|nr:flagellar basal body-associated FliL family protein [Sphingomonas sp. RIT328]